MLYSLLFLKLHNEGSIMLLHSQLGLTIWMQTIVANILQHFLTSKNILLCLLKCSFRKLFFMWFRL